MVSDKKKPLKAVGRMKKAGTKAISYVNVPRIACDHLIGEHHSKYHRMGAGVIIMAIGVIISKQFADIHIFFVHYILDGFGYLIHGIGTIPFAEALTENQRKRMVRQVEEEIASEEEKEEVIPK